MGNIETNIQQEKVWFRKILLAFGLCFQLLVWPMLLMVCPKPSDWNFLKFGVVSFPLVIDTDGFIDPAIHLEKLFEPKQPRQSRPLYVVVGHGMGESIHWFINSWNPEFYTFIEKKLNAHAKGYFLESGNPLDLLTSYYIGFVLLNFLVLGLFTYFWWKLSLRWCIPIWLSILGFSLFLVNDITRTFLFTVHQQMFTFLTPMAMLYYLDQMSDQTGSTSKFRLYLLSFGWGIVFLVYGNILLLAPVFMLGALLSHGKFVWSFPNLAQGMAVGLVFILPTICWISWVKSTTGFYYNYEMEEFRQLVWIFDYYQRLGVLKTGYITLVYTLNFFKTFIYRDIWPFLALLIVWIMYKRPQKLDFRTFLDIQENWKKVFFVSLVSFLFFWVLGYYRPRITFFLVVPIVWFLMDAIGKSKPKTWLKWTIGILSLIWWGFHISSQSHYM